jgi:DNA-binding CsgD family transcriptional regulator
MVTYDQHKALTAKLYRAAAGELAWTQVLADLAGLFRSSAAICQVADAGFSNVLRENHGYSREFSDAYFASEAFARNPRMAYFYAVPTGTAYYDNALYDVAAMDRDPWAQLNVDILGIKYQLGTIVKLPNDQRGSLTVLSTPKEGHATEEAIIAFSRLIPHVEQALSLGHLLNYQAATQFALFEALSSMADGVMVLSRLGLPTFVNDAAQLILAAGDGLRLADGLEAARSSETRRLKGLIAAASATGTGGDAAPGGRMLVSRPSGRKPIMVRVMPVPATDGLLGGWSASCLVLLHDLARVVLPSRESLGEVFGLTAREADLAVELVRHADLTAAAASAGMAFNTARVHLQGIYRKCGVSSQAQAVQLFARLR